MSKRFLGSVMKVLGYIDATAIRFYDKDEVFKFATFSIGDESYKMLSDGRLYKEITFNDYKFVEPHWCKGGIYPEVIINGCPIKSYVLALTLTDTNFYDRYMNDSSLVVNHTVTEYNQDYLCFDGYRAVVKPKRSVSYNPTYIECVTRSANTKHGRLIDDYGLYGIYVSADDVDELKRILVNLKDVDDDYKELIARNNKELTMQYYYERGKDFDLQPK